MSLRWKLVIMCLALALLPLGVMGGVSFLKAREALQKALFEKMRIAADYKESEVLIYFRRSKTISKDFASDGFIKNGLEALLSDHLGGIYSVGALNAHLITNKIVLHSDLMFIDVTDVHGKIISSSIPQRVGLERRQNGHFHEGLSGPHIMSFKKETDHVGMEVIVPVKGARDTAKTIGFLFSHFNVEALSGLLMGEEVMRLGAHTQTIGIGKTGRVYLVNSDKVFVSGTFREEALAFKQRVDTYPVQRCLEHGEEVVGEWKNFNGVDVIGAAMCMDIEDARWVLLVEQEEWEAFDPIEDLGLLFLCMGLFVSCGVIFTAVLSAKTVSGPLNRLAQFATRVSDGGGMIGQTIDLDRADEIGILAKALNSMIVSLQKTMGDLDEKNRIIVKSMKELKEVNAELDKFVYTSSHDLRAPLRGISSFATFLEEDYKDKLDDEGKDYLQEIRKGADRMERLIEDLLELSRISRIRNPYEPVDIRAIIRDVAARLQQEIAAHRVELEVAEHMPTVCCDRIKIGEVFFNLIHNAIKFSFKNTMKTPKVDVGYSGEGTCHQFYVRDNGIGIAPKYQEQIFQIFQRLHTEAEYEGTGIGLSIVQKIVEEHEGRIWVDSQLGEGATFYFTISKELQNGCGRCKDNPAGLSCASSSTKGETK